MMMEGGPRSDAKRQSKPRADAAGLAYGWTVNDPVGLLCRGYALDEGMGHVLLV
jgi:hypothetical protein